MMNALLHLALCYPAWQVLSYLVSILTRFRRLFLTAQLLFLGYCGYLSPFI